MRGDTNDASYPFGGCASPISATSAQRRGGRAVAAMGSVDMLLGTLAAAPRSAPRRRARSSTRQAPSSSCPAHYRTETHRLLETPRRIRRVVRRGAKAGLSGGREAAG